MSVKNEKTVSEKKDLMKKRLLVLQKFFVERTDEQHQTNTIELEMGLEHYIMKARI